MRSILGVSLLSAAGSLPLHLLPLLVAAVLHDGRLPLAQAGWIGSAYMLGQLAVVLALPALHVRRLLRWQMAAAVVLLVIVLLASSSWRGPALVAGWLVLGALCGLLHYAASTTAAASGNRRQAFALRMAISSLVGGCVILALQLAQGLEDYRALVAPLAAAYAAIGAVALLLDGSRVAAGMPDDARANPFAVPTGALLGLAVLFLLFAGQHGLWAFAVRSAQQRGMALDALACVIAGCKLAAAVVVLAGARHASMATPAPSLLGAGVAVAAGGMGLAFAGDLALYCLGILLWEVGFNVLSARLQAAAAHDQPQLVGMWLMAAIFLGAAAGPAMGGWFVRADSYAWFVAFAATTALLPHAWAWGKARVQARRAGASPAGADA